MYVDQVFRFRDGECIMGGSPRETRAFLKVSEFSPKNLVYVIQGRTGMEYSVEDYLALGRTKNGDYNETPLT